MADQGKFRFPGIVGVLGASYSRTRGIAPNIAQVEIPPSGTLEKYGTMQWIYGLTTYSFPNCVVEDVEVTRPGGHIVWVVHIADRRAYWRFGAISGEYNIKTEDQLIPEREKSPQELAELLLEAMGETNYDVSQLPNDTRPHVEWDLANPAQELESLCDSLGCTVVLKLDDSVVIEPYGVGSELPAGWMSLEYEFDPAVTPSEIIFCPAPTRWQMDLLLEAVGEEADGEIKLLNDLSYTPANGWEQEDPVHFPSITDAQDRDLAKRSVWRMYRVTVSEDNKLEPYKSEEEVTEVERILPLIAEQVETEGIGERRKPKECIVWGRFYDAHGVGTANVSSIGTDLPTGTPALKYEGSFSVDAEHGIVKFSEPVFLLLDTIATRVGYLPADLRLRCSIRLKNSETRAFWRMTKEIVGDTLSPSQPLYLNQNDVEHLIYKDDTTDEYVDNEADVLEAADYYLVEAVKKYIPSQSANAVYAGFIGLDLDGLVAEVSFSIANRSYEATSKASLNAERNLVTPSNAERRERERLKQALKERDIANRKNKRRKQP